MVVIAAAHAAHADGRDRVGVGLYEIDGSNEALQRDMRTALYGGLAAVFDLVPEQQAHEQLSSAQVVVCDTMVCLRRIGEVLKVRYVVKATTKSINASNYVTELELIDTLEGRVVVRSGDKCQVCTQKEVFEGISNAAVQLKLELDKTKPQTLPPGNVNGERSRRRQFRGAAIGAWGAAAASLAAGIALLAIDNTERSYSLDSTGHVSVERYDTVIGGAVLTSVGVALAASGGALWWRGGKERPVVSVAPSRSGVGVALSGAW